MRRTIHGRSGVLHEGRSGVLHEGRLGVLHEVAVREYKQKAKVKQLGLAGLRRNGQLAAAPRGAPEP